jgi:hypothetical protein
VHAGEQSDDDAGRVEYGHASLGTVPFNPMDTSASMGLMGDDSRIQDLSNPRADVPGPSGVLRQAYDLCDSMGQVGDHTIVPSDHLDTGVMMTVPQVRLLPSLFKLIS